MTVRPFSVHPAFRGSLPHREHGADVPEDPAEPARLRRRHRLAGAQHPHRPAHARPDAASRCERRGGDQEAPLLREEHRLQQAAQEADPAPVQAERRQPSRTPLS